MNQLFKFRRKNSGEIARDRLKLVLLSDKANCSPEIMEMIKHDMIHTISRYIEIDSEAIELGMARRKASDGRTDAPVLFANIPLRDTQNKGIYHNAI